jgi:CxxC motif-containing protein (DUF1111 family)
LPNNVQLAQRNTTALFGLGLIDQIPDRVIVAGERQQRLAQGMAKGEASEKAVVGRVHRLSDGRIGRFGWKAHVATLSDFVQVACANELGLGNPGHAQPASLAQVTYQPPGLDLTQQQCDQLTSFISTLPRPVEVLSAKAEAGKAHFAKTGCADCHTPNLGSVSGLYSDLLMHRMGQTLEGGGSYGAPIRTTPTSPSASDPLPDEWRTPPLWGVADSAPYMHDGRAATLEEAISMHGGQAAAAAGRFAGLAPREQQELVAFLRSLRAP